MVSTAVSAIHSIQDIERRALADLWTYCSMDLSTEHQTLVGDLTPHATESIHSIYAHLRAHQSTVTVPLPHVVVVVKPDDVNVSILFHFSRHFLNH